MTAPGVMPDSLVSACNQLDGVQVLWISRYGAGGNLFLDLEAVEPAIPGGKKTATGAWGTDASILDELAAQGIQVDASMAPLTMVGNPAFPRTPHVRQTGGGPVIEMPP